jgi:hypothetical protein
MTSQNIDLSSWDTLYTIATLMMKNLPALETRYSQPSSHRPKSTVLFVTTCSSEIARRFGVKYRLHIQGRKVSQTENQHKQTVRSTLHYNSEVRTRHNHRCDNLRLSMWLLTFDSAHPMYISTTYFSMALICIGEVASSNLVRGIDQPDWSLHGFLQYLEKYVGIIR